MILRVALHLVDDLAILPKLSVELLSGLMRDAMALNQNRRPTQHEAGPSISGSQMRLGEIAELRSPTTNSGRQRRAQTRAPRGKGKCSRRPKVHQEAPGLD